MTGTRRNAALLIVAYAALAAVLLWLLARSIAEGGNPWQQGDWLINYGAGFVRRGLSGHLILGASDGLGVDALILLGVVQALLLVALIAGILRAALATGVPDRLLILLVSPAFQPFWAHDYLGAMRKEMVALLAFLPLLRPAATLAGARLRALVALALFTLAVALHEANAFLAPFFAAALWLSLPPALPRRTCIGAVFAIAGAAMAAALLFSTVDDPAAVCREITDHGLREGLCSGAIDWLGFDLDRVFHEGRSRLATFGVPWSALLSYTLALMPIVAALWQAPRRGLLIAATLASGLALAPLYVVALDWGRWIFLHTACVTLVILTAANHRSLPWLHRPLDHRILVFLLAASALWSMSFFTGETGPGLLPQLILSTFGR